MTNFTHQPERLPATLPAGTRFKYGSSTWEADEELRLDLRDPSHPRYVGLLLHKQSDARDSFGMAARVDWSSVPAPPEYAEPPHASECHPTIAWLECAGCHRLTPAPGGVCNVCHSQLTPTPGSDWPPCRDCGGSVHPGASGPGGVCGSCAVNPSPSPTCSECKAPAVLTECYGGMLCGYCADSLEDGHGDREHIDMVTARQMLKAEMSDGSPIPGELAARKRLAAIEQKRPRVNAAERRQMEAGHPIGWPSNEGED